MDNSCPNLCIADIGTVLCFLVKILTPNSQDLCTSSEVDCELQLVDYFRSIFNLFLLSKGALNDVVLFWTEFNTGLVLFGTVVPYFVLGKVSLSVSVL